MTVADLIILPGILIGAFLGVVLVVIVKVAGNMISRQRAQKAAAQIPDALLRQQAMVIQDTIYELEANRLSYTEFPKELKDRLIDAHAAWADPQERKGIRR